MLPKPPRPSIVFEKPIRLVPLIDKLRFEKLRVDVFDKVQKDVDVNKKYLEGLKDTVGIFAGVKSGAATTPGGFTQPGGGLVQPGDRFTDTVLNMHTAGAAVKAQAVDTIRVELLNPELEAGKRATLEKQLETAELELGNAVVGVMQYVADAKLDVKTGTEGAAAVAIASASLGKVANIDALAKVEKELNTVGGRAGTTPDAKVVIGQILGGRMR